MARQQVLDLGQREPAVVARLADVLCPDEIEFDLAPLGHRQWHDLPVDGLRSPSGTLVNVVGTGAFVLGVKSLPLSAVPGGIL